MGYAFFLFPAFLAAGLGLIYWYFNREEHLHGHNYFADAQREVRCSSYELYFR